MHGMVYFSLFSKGGNTRFLSVTIVDRNKISLCLVSGKICSLPVHVFTLSLRLLLRGIMAGCSWGGKVLLGSVGQS